MACMYCMLLLKYFDCFPCLSALPKPCADNVAATISLARALVF